MEIFKLFGSIFVDNAEANASIAKTEEKAEGLHSKLAKGVGTAIKWGAGIAAGASAAVGGLMALVNKTGQYADEIDKLSERTGINREELQRWKYAAGQSGADIGKLEVGIKTMSDAMYQAARGNKNAVQAFERLGVSLRNADGSARSTEAVFEDVMRALADMEQGAERNALGNDVLGRSYVELLPLLNAGSEGMQELKDRADELGIVMSEDAVKAGVQFGDTIDDLKQAFGGAWNQLAMLLMPYLQKMADWIIEHMPQIQRTVSGVFKVIGTVIGGAVKIIGGVIDVISTVIDKAQKAWEWVKKVFGGGDKSAGPSSSYSSAAGSTPPDTPGLAGGGEIVSSGWVRVGERGPEDLYLPRGAQVVPLTAGAHGYTQRVEHTGTIRVEGVNDKKQLTGVVNIIMDELRREARR